MSISQLVLGTARFGLDGHYGFQARKPDEETVAAIVGRAWQGGVRWLDTAEAYGDAEARLGQIGVSKFRAVSKIAPNLWDLIPPASPQLEQALAKDSDRYAASCRRLGVSGLDGYLLHSARYAFREDIVERFLAIYHQALGVPLVGVSCYEPAEAFAALKAGCTALQVPHNLFDLRAWDAGVFVEAERRGATVFARSPFCQGLLVLPHAEVPEEFRASPLPYRRGWCLTGQAVRVELALSAALTTAERVVFGCESVRQLEQDMGVAALPKRTAMLEYGRLCGGVTEPIVNPSRFVVAAA